MREPKFKKGDKVKLTTGTSPIIVEYINKDPFSYNLKYVKSGKLLFWVAECLLEFFEEPEQRQEEENMTQLYEITFDGKTTYGTKLAKNSDKNWVLEEKGTGQIIVASDEQLKKVMPYTIGVKFGGEGQEYSYTAEKGKYEKGQVFLVTSNAGNYQIAVVHRVDTESEKATKEFEPIARILTE